MTTFLPERVDPSSATLAEIARNTLAEARTSDDRDWLWEQRRRAAALRHFVERAEDRRALSQAEVGLLVELGRVLGTNPGSVAGPGRGKTVPRAVRFPRNRVHEARLLAHWYYGLADPVIVAAVDRGDRIKTILAKIAERTPVDGTQLRLGPMVVDLSARWAVHATDFRDLAAELPDRSVDMIVTDPPYPAEFLPLWDDLGAVAARVLKPRGLFAALSGKIFLPDVLDMLGRHLTYGWVFMYDLPGNHSRIFSRRLMQTWKPLLLYTTGSWARGEWRDDRVTSPAPDKAEFAWGQSVPPMVEMIESYSRPNALVFDPFTGGGAYGEAALRAGRRFIGAEIDPSKADQARARIARAEQEIT